MTNIPKRAIKARPVKMVLYGVEGWGKTTTAAYAPQPHFITCELETGYQALRDCGRVPCTGTFKHVDTYKDLIEAVETVPEHTESLVIDALGSLERLIQQKVLVESFDNEWEKFQSYGKGAQVCQQYWIGALRAVERVYNSGKNVVLLAHAQIEKFDDPTSAKYDRYSPDIERRYAWPAVNRWCSAVLFGKFRTIVDRVDKMTRKGKGIGGDERVLYCQQRDAYVAKNMFGMKAELSMGDNPADNWGIIIKEISNAH